VSAAVDLEIKADNDWWDLRPQVAMLL